MMLKKVNNQQATMTPQLSPYLFLGLLARPLLNKPLLDPIFNLAAKILQSKHPRIPEELARFAPTDILIDPTDLPFSLLITIKEHANKQQPITVQVVEKYHVTSSNVAIKGSFSVLLKMLEGELDGDALFFSRQLTVVGCTEIVVVLRNILEAENINLSDELLSLFGPFGRLLEKPLGLLRSIHETIMNRITTDIGLIQQSCVSEVEKYCHQQKKNHETLVDEIDSLKKQLTQSEHKINRLRDKLRSVPSMSKEQ